MEIIATSAVVAVSTGDWTPPLRIRIALSAPTRVGTPAATAGETKGDPRKADTPPATGHDAK
jgi:hypothetical protein